MNNLLLISTSYRILDLAEVGFAFGQKVEGFSIENKGTDLRCILELLGHNPSKTTQRFLKNKNDKDDISELVLIYGS